MRTRLFAIIRLLVIFAILWVILAVVFCYDREKTRREWENSHATFFDSSDETWKLAQNAPIKLEEAYNRAIACFKQTEYSHLPGFCIKLVTSRGDDYFFYMGPNRKKKNYQVIGVYVSSINGYAKFEHSDRFMKWNTKGSFFQKLRDKIADLRN